MRRFLLCLLLGLTGAPGFGQIFISTGSSSGLRLYYPSGNDWWVDPSQGRFDLRVNGGAAPVASVDAAGAVKGSSVAVTGTGTAPFDLTASSGVHILSGKLKLESGAWIEYADGTISVSSASNGAAGAPLVASGTVTINVAVTQQVPSACVGGSTLSFSSSSGYVEVGYTGSVENESANGPCALTVLVDGQIPPPFGSSPYAITQAVSSTGGYPQNASFRVPLSVGAGSAHNYCLVLWNTAGATTCYIGYHLTSAYGSTQPIFYVTAGVSGR